MLWIEDEFRPRDFYADPDKMLLLVKAGVILLMADDLIRPSKGIDLER